MQGLIERELSGRFHSKPLDTLRKSTGLLATSTRTAPEVRTIERYSARNYRSQRAHVDIPADADIGTTRSRTRSARHQQPALRCAVPWATPNSVWRSADR